MMMGKGMILMKNLEDSSIVDVSYNSEHKNHWILRRTLLLKSVHGVEDML